MDDPGSTERISLELEPGPADDGGRGAPGRGGRRSASGIREAEVGLVPYQGGTQTKRWWMGPQGTNPRGALSHTLFPLTPELIDNDQEGPASTQPAYHRSSRGIRREPQGSPPVPPDPDSLCRGARGDLTFHSPQGGAGRPGRGPWDLCNGACRLRAARSVGGPGARAMGPVTPAPPYQDAERVAAAEGGSVAVGPPLAHRRNPTHL